MTRQTYGTAHARERKRWAPIIASGKGWCTEPICLMPDRHIPPGSAWDLAHDAATNTYRGPAHPRCNRSEGAARGNRERGTKRRRRWTL